MLKCAIPLLKIKSFVSLKKSLCFFWMRGHFKGEVKFSKILRGVAHKEGV